MDASFAVSIVAVLVAGGSLVVAVRAERRATRAESSSRRADLVVEPAGSSGDGSGRRFALRVRNVGSAVARGVRVWLEDEAGRVVSTVAGETTSTLARDDEPVTLVLTVPEARLPPPPVTFAVLASWSDPAGHHEGVATGVTVST